MNVCILMTNTWLETGLGRYPCLFAPTLHPSCGSWSGGTKQSSRDGSRTCARFVEVGGRLGAAVDAAGNAATTGKVHGTGAGENIGREHIAELYGTRNRVARPSLPASYLLPTALLSHEAPFALHIRLHPAEHFAVSCLRSVSVYVAVAALCAHSLNRVPHVGTSY